ncbi:MAG: hypothetical protein MUE45_01365 [Methanoregulaceae archaeon]|jgi:hypothetical protein|nr:hypothetical protein [Methanoregulaceae archaeon]MCU0628126.1 hypothetical protein [Methanoregulaceae archaeon]
MENPSRNQDAKWAARFQIPGTMSIFAALPLTLLSFSAGYAAGRADRNIRQVFAQGTAQRNLATTLIVAILVFRDESVITIMLITGSLALYLPLPQVEHEKKENSYYPFITSRIF